MRRRTLLRRCMHRQRTHQVQQSLSDPRCLPLLKKIWRQNLLLMRMLQPTDRLLKATPKRKSIQHWTAFREAKAR